MPVSASQRSLVCCLLDHFYQDLDWENHATYAHHVRYEADNLLQLLEVTREDAAEAECAHVIREHFTLGD